MPLTGSETALAQEIEGMVFKELESGGFPVQDRKYIQLLAKGIAKAIAPHIVTNAVVNPGQTVTGTAGPYPVVAATVTPGTLS